MLALVLVGIWLARPVQANGPIRVDVDATCDPCNGETWGSAYPSLQDALAVATTGDEIWVATGVYTPGVTITATFVPTDGVALYGGFVATETLRSQRDWQNNVTVLSGDIDGDDQTDAHGVITHTDHINGSNSYHVVTSQGVTETVVLDGFTLTGGNANGSYPNDRGGGMFNWQSSPTVRNVTFSGNTAGGTGGGMFNYYSSNPALTNVTFSGNAAEVWGGGMLNFYSSNPALTNVTFSGNTADHGGGMVNYDYSYPELANCILWGNTPNQIHNYNNSSPTISYSLVEGGWSGTGNIDADPQFVDADGPDNTPGTLDDNLRLKNLSRRPLMPGITPLPAWSASPPTWTAIPALSTSPLYPTLATAIHLSSTWAPMKPLPL
jgi:hypothetical protein